MVISFYPIRFPSKRKSSQCEEAYIPWTPRAKVVYDQVSNDRMEQSAKDSIQKPPVKESEALLASEIGTGTPSFRQWEHSMTRLYRTDQQLNSSTKVRQSHVLYSRFVLNPIQLEGSRHPLRLGSHVMLSKDFPLLRKYRPSSRISLPSSLSADTLLGISANGGEAAISLRSCTCKP